MRYEFVATIVDASTDDEEGLSSVYFQAAPRDDRVFSIARFTGDEDDGLCQFAVGGDRHRVDAAPASVVLDPGRLVVRFPGSIAERLGGIQDVRITWGISSVRHDELRAALESVLRGYENVSLGLAQA